MEWSLQNAVTTMLLVSVVFEKAAAEIMQSCHTKA